MTAQTKTMKVSKPKHGLISLHRYRGQLTVLFFNGALQHLPEELKQVGICYQKINKKENRLGKRT